MKDRNFSKRNQKIFSFYFNAGSDRIFCTLFGEPKKTKECIIYFAPLFEERMWSQRIAFNFAKEIVNQTNQAVLIFDYYGYGESDGDSENFNLEHCKKNLEALTKYTKNEFGFSNYTFWGIRTGCAVALKCISVSSNVSSVILWAPILDLNAFVIKSLRSTISAQLFMFREILANRDEIIDDLLKKGKCVRKDNVLNNIDGYRISKEFFIECTELSINELLHKLSCPVLILDIVEHENKKNSHKTNEEKYSNLPNISHMISTDRNFWLNSLDYSQIAETTYKITIQWLQDCRG